MLLAACGGGGRAGYTADQQTVDGITFKLERPEQLKLLQDYQLYLTLTDASGKPIDGAIVFMEQDMAAMPMQSNQPLGEPLGNGQYRIAGVFTMEGDWHLVVHAKLGGKETVATFKQNVSPQP